MIMQLKVLDSVYKPREDSFLLQKQVEKRAKGKRVLDMGCGTGIQAISAAKAGAKEVWAADLNTAALTLANENAELNNVEIRPVLSDLFLAVHPGEMFDLIVFNPPYLPSEIPVDVQWSGGAELIKKFLEQAKKHLNENGEILFVFSSLTKLKDDFKVVAEQTMPDGEKLFIGLAKRTI